MTEVFFPLKFVFFSPCLILSLNLPVGASSYIFFSAGLRGLLSNLQHYFFAVK